MNQEPLPQIHLIRDTDLSIFAYELHIFAGDFLRECEFNMRSLATNTGADSIAIMGKNHMWLSDALFAYCSTADLHQMILTTEFIGARAFLFHTDRSEGGHLYGDVLMMDLDTLRQDIKRNILYPCGVNIERKDGSVATVSLKEWTGMELYEKDALKSWGFSYAPNQVTEWQYHYSTMFRQWMDQAFRYMPQDLEERLNMQYMEAAQNPDMDKYRIPQGTAKQMDVWEHIDIQFLKKRNLPVPENYVTEICARSFEEAAQYTIDLFGLQETVEGIIEEWNNMAVEEYRNHVGLLPYALDYLLRLKEHGIKLAVATGLPENLYIPCLKNNSILELFDALCSTDEVQRGKEYSDVFELAARKLGVAPEHCIVFDDVLPAIKSAKAARMLAGGIYDKYSADQRTEIERIADIYLLDFRQAPIPHKEV